MNQAVFGVLFAAVAGIMVFISFDELLPAAREYGEHHLSIYGMVAGMDVPTAESVKKRSFPWGWTVAGAAVLGIAGAALHAHKHRDDDIEEE